MSLAVYVIAALAVLRFVLVAVVVGVALKTSDQDRRDVALAILRILRPILGKGPRSS